MNKDRIILKQILEVLDSHYSKAVKERDEIREEQEADEYCDGYLDDEYHAACSKADGIHWLMKDVKKVLENNGLTKGE